MRGSITALALWVMGCAGASSNVTATELLASDELLFDHAVDFVEDPVVIRDEWGGTFERRVARSDLIAVVRISSLSADTLPRRAAYRLTAKVKSTLKGSAPREVVLRVDDDQAGYQSVRVHEDRLLQDSFVAFVKWGSGPESEGPIAHWHLSPDSETVRENVDFFLRQPPPPPEPPGP